jgi:hypothetical protein
VILSSVPGGSYHGHLCGDNGTATDSGFIRIVLNPATDVGVDLCAIDIVSAVYAADRSSHDVDRRGVDDVTHAPSRHPVERL